MVEIVDIKFKPKGFWSEYVVYRDIKNHSITYTDYHVMITFTKIYKKHTREYMFTIPKDNLHGIHIRRTTKNV